MNKFEHVQGGFLYSEVPYPGDIGGGWGPCIVRSNALWVMATWDPLLPPRGQTDTTEKLPSHNFVRTTVYSNEQPTMNFLISTYLYGPRNRAWYHSTNVSSFVSDATVRIFSIPSTATWVQKRWVNNSFRIYDVMPTEFGVISSVLSMFINFLIFY